MEASDETRLSINGKQLSKLGKTTGMLANLEAALELFTGFLCKNFIHGHFFCEQNFKIYEATKIAQLFFKNTRALNIIEGLSSSC